MSHLLRRTKKSCLKLLRKISTSKQLFVQRLDEDEEGYEEEQQMEREEETDYSTNDKQYECHNNNSSSSSSNNSNNNSNPDLSVQCCEQKEPPIDIQFDLMHYKENVRYLRHTPSNSSVDLQLEQQREREREREQRQQRGGSVSVGSQFDGHYHNVIIMEQPPNDDYPIVKWDINGNSLDEEQFDLRQHWDAFDSRWRQLQSVPAAAAKRLGSGHSHSHSHSQRSSHHSSSCTLETWIDDAEMGFGDDSQNLLQPNKNNSHNNNNCNQCLKSF